MTPRGLAWPVVAYEDAPGYRYVREARNVLLPDQLIVVIGKNPSTADEAQNDSTVRHVQEWATQEKRFGRICFVNLFALRSSNPIDIEFDPDGEIPVARAIGERNNEVLLRQARRGGVVVAAWGDDEKLTLRARYRSRIAEVLDLLADVPLHTMGDVSNAGHPVHGFRWHGLRQGRVLVPADLDRLDPRKWSHAARPERRASPADPSRGLPVPPPDPGGGIRHYF